MAVAPLGWEPDAAFGRLADDRARLRSRLIRGADWISAGMSEDLESAISARLDTCPCR